MSASPQADWDERSFTESGHLVSEIIRQWHAIDYAGATTEAPVQGVSDD